MAKEQSPNLVEKRFWENNERFADIFNAFFFEGEPVIDPNLLQERNTDVAVSIPLGNLFEHEKKYEEVSKIYQGAELSILGIINQKEWLSGMKNGDRLHMSLRIVIYYGEEPWDGPRKLLDMVEIPNAFKPYFQLKA